MAVSSIGWDIHLVKPVASASSKILGLWIITSSKGGNSIVAMPRGGHSIVALSSNSNM